MKNRFKLFFKYVLCLKSTVFLNQIFKNEKSSSILLNANFFYYFAIHLKLSTVFYSNQLIDLFVYEINSCVNTKINALTNSEVSGLTYSPILVYNFHNLFLNQRISVFVISQASGKFSKTAVANSQINSISELFANANWLEREASELNNVFFYFKKDLRNLMLPYGDSSAPMKKSSPAIGSRELYYDSNVDALVQAPITIQF